MRTTVDLPDALFRKAKAIASLRGLTLKQLITVAIERELSSEVLQPPGRRVRLPLVPSNRPGSVALTGEGIARILDQEDLDGPA